MRVLVKVRRHRWCSHQAVHDGRTRNSWMADTRRSKADYIKTAKEKKRICKGNGPGRRRVEKGA